MKRKPNSIRSKKPVCLDTSDLRGACCTNRCKSRSSCTVFRIKFLLYAVVYNKKTDLTYVDTYINDIFHLKAGGKGSDSEFQTDENLFLANIKKPTLEELKKPWRDRESLFCDKEFLTKMFGKEPLEVERIKDEDESTYFHQKRAKRRRKK